MTDQLNPTTGEDTPLRALPVQWIEVPDGVLLVRGCLTVQVGGEGALEAVKIVLAAAATEKGATRQEILSPFAAPDRLGAEELVEMLVARRLLVPADSFPVPSPAGETAQEVFYWEFGERADQVTAQLSTRRIAVLGVNCISQQLIKGLGRCGFEAVTVVDFPLLRNQRLYPNDTLAVEEWDGPTPVPVDAWEQRLEEGLDCVVATADFSGQQLLRHWNQWCVERKCAFLPVLLDRMVGFVGPLVIPGETACYECLWARENSSADNAETNRLVEDLGAVVKRPALHGFLPPMASILGDLAALELTKFCGGAVPIKVGTLLEVKFLRTEMRGRKVLRVPRCAVCSSLNRTASINPEKFRLLPGDYLTRAVRE
jgi:bacteriocin biosynthesis cyclodehydratase domain-containing protein